MFKRSPVALCILLALFGCATGCATANNNTATVSLKSLVYGMSDNSVAPALQKEIPATMMMQMRALFDRIKAADASPAGFQSLTINLGDGNPVLVLGSTTGDKFLPGKLALGLSHVLIDMKIKGDPKYPEYLATYQKITDAMITPMNPANPGNYLYANTSFGEYYYLIALSNFKANGMMNEVFSDKLLATLKSRLTFCDMFGKGASSTSNTCPQNGAIDINTLNTAQNYYGVSYGIAGLRQQLGWDNPKLTSTDPAESTAIANLTTRDALLYKLAAHIRNDSSGGFSDEASNRSTVYYDQSRFDRYSTLLIAEVVGRSLEMNNKSGVSDELKKYLRNSVDQILPQLNTEGKGINYGRSIGPYGDTAFVEILTAAANMDILSAKEMDIAYAFITKAAYRFNTFWYDPTLPNPSVNMWVKGRGTDTYRGKARALGENFSLLHQYISVNAWWDKLGYADKEPLSDAELQAWLDSTQPRYKLTWYNQPDDKAHPYSAALITVRDKQRIINLNLSQAPNYNHFTPYLPVPFSDKLIYGATDLSYALLVPQINYNGINYLPVTYYKNLSVTEKNGKVIVTYDTAKFRKAEKDPAAATDLDVQAHTVITFDHGAISRTDTLTSATLTGNITVSTDFTSFAKLQDALAGNDGYSVKYQNSDATSYRTSGFDSCVLSDFSKVGDKINNLSTTPIGQQFSKFACSANPFALSTTGRSLSWELQYRP